MCTCIARNMFAGFFFYASLCVCVRLCVIVGLITSTRKSSAEFPFIEAEHKRLCRPLPVNSSAAAFAVHWLVGPRAFDPLGLGEFQDEEVGFP